MKLTDEEGNIINETGRPSNVTIMKVMERKNCTYMEAEDYLFNRYVPKKSWGRLKSYAFLTGFVVAVIVSKGLIFLALGI